MDVTDDELKGLFEAMRQEMTGGFEAMRQEMTGGFAAVRQEMTAMRQETEDRFDAMRQENAAAHAETRRQFGATQEHLESRFELLAETVQLLDANQRATARTLDDKIERLVAETQGLIRFGYDDLNRRVLVLEGNAGTKKESAQRSVPHFHLREKLPSRQSVHDSDHRLLLTPIQQAVSQKRP